MKYKIIKPYDYVKSIQRMVSFVKNLFNYEFIFS